MSHKSPLGCGTTDNLNSCNNLTALQMQLDIMIANHSDWPFRQPNFAFNTLMPFSDNAREISKAPIDPNKRPSSPA